MKKILSFLMIGALALSLVACGSSKKAAEATTESADSSLPEYEDVKIDNPGEYVELGKYKGLTIEGYTYTVSEEEIDDAVEDLRNNSFEDESEDGYEDGYYQKVDRKVVEDGDVVNLDFECTTAKGEAVEEFTQDAFDVTLGSEEMVYGDDLNIESALVGKKVGEKVKVTGSIYDDEDIYGDLAGQKVTFVVTINYIEEEPEIDDEFVKEHTEYNTLKEYKEAIRQELQEQAELDVDNENREALWELVVKNSKQIKDFPADMIAKERKNVIITTREMANYYGMEEGMSEEELEKFYKENFNQTFDEGATDSLFRQCILQLLVEKEGLEPTDKEIDEAVKEEMEIDGFSSEEEFYEEFSREELRDMIIQEKVMQLLIENATIKKK